METLADSTGAATAPTTRRTPTPGPWRITLHGAFADDGTPIVGIWIDGGDFCSIANLMPRPEVQANAHLFVAAPDLLEALKALVAETERCDRPGLYGVESDAAQMVAARAAIAKAEGR